MKDAKKSMHSLYQITRNVDFIKDMSNILSIASDKQEQLLFLIHSKKDDSEGIEDLAQFLIRCLHQVDLGLLDKNGMVRVF